MTGKDFIGRTVITSPTGYLSTRSMHISRGLPLTSPLHEPHRPALQFHRQARSGARSAWTLWMASRTTMPGWRGTVYSTMVPDSRVPRWMLRVTSSAIGRLLGARSAGPDRGPPAVSPDG